MASAAELSALDKGAALLDELYDLLRVRLDYDLRSLTRLLGNSARAMPDGRLNLRTKYLAESLCTKLAHLMLRLRPQGQARGPHRVAFLGTTGTGKSFVLDCLLMLLCLGDDEYGQKADERLRHDLLEHEVLVQAPGSPGFAAPLSAGPSNADHPASLSLIDEDDAEPGSPPSPYGQEHHEGDGTIDWAAEMRALAAFTSRVVWNSAADPEVARDAHLLAADWDAHSFLLRLSAGGTGTAKFVELADAPRFGAELTLCDPRTLVKQLIDLHDLQKMVTRGLKKEEEARRQLLLHVWRALSGSASGAEPSSSEELHALGVFARSFGKPTGYRKHVENSWKQALPPTFCGAMNRHVLDPMFCKVLVQTPPTAVPERERDRVIVRDEVCDLLAPDRGLACLVDRARLQVPLGRCGLRHVLLTDVAGTMDASAAHAADTRAAVAETDLAIVVLEVDANRKPKVDQSLAASLRSSPFIRRMLLAAPGEQTCGLVLVVNADKCHPPLEERPEDVAELRVKLCDSVLVPCAEALIHEGAQVAAVTLNHAAAAAAARGATFDEDASDTEGEAPAAGLTEAEALARIAAIQENVPVVYLHPHTAAAAVHAAANPDLLARYCAAPATFGVTAPALPQPAPLERQQLESLLRQSGLPRLLELVSAVRAPEAAALPQVLQDLETHLEDAIQEIERRTISLPTAVYEIFGAWSNHLNVNVEERRPGRPRTHATVKVPRVPLARINASVNSVVDAVFWSKLQARTKRGWEIRAVTMREQLRKHMQTHEDWLNPRKRCDTPRTFSLRQLIMPALSDCKPVAEALVKELTEAAAELLQHEHDAMWNMYDPPTQGFRKRFDGAPFSAGEAGERERGALQLLQATHRAEVNCLLGHSLLARLVNCSMVPRPARKLEGDEPDGWAASDDVAAEESDTETKDADTRPVAVLFGKGLRRAAEALLEEHCVAAVEHLCNKELKDALSRLQHAASPEEAAAALAECHNGVVDHAVPLFKRLMRESSFIKGRGKLSTELKMLAKQFCSCLSSDIAVAKVEILRSWQASLKAFGDASAPQKEAAPEPLDGELRAKLSARLEATRELCTTLRSAQGEPPAGAATASHDYGLRCITAMQMLCPSRLPRLAAQAALGAPRARDDADDDEDQPPSQRRRTGA